MASIAFLVTTVITILFTATAVSSFYGSSPVCISSGEDESLYSCACSEEKFPDDDDTTWQDGQEAVLTFLDGNLLEDGYSDVCINATYYGTRFFLYGGCNDDHDLDTCKTCLQEARSVVSSYCPNATGAQAASRRCCVRYEKYKLCCEP
ncbi:unnamed protein product [Linum trigynum]|uniref:Gnk2-homologous domain-containing protein n=1 Tax=Linum trigynum TaxID=586398 RepID=A0AAV2GFT7_9ROSI